MSHEPDELAPDLRDVAHALTEHRARMSGPQLARVRERAIGSGSRMPTAPRGGFMRSRIAITALLASGALMSSGGAAIGVTALSTTNDASQAQYGTVATTATEKTPTERLGPSGDTLGGGAQAANTPSGGQGAGTPADGVKSSGGVKSAGDESTPTAQAQPARQLESGGGDELPFTGFAAIPLLLVGLALLVTGLVLRRGTSPDAARLS